MTLWTDLSTISEQVLTSQYSYHTSIFFKSNNSFAINKWFQVVIVGIALLTLGDNFLDIRATEIGYNQKVSSKGPSSFYYCNFQWMASA